MNSTPMTLLPIRRSSSSCLCLLRYRATSYKHRHTKQLQWVIKVKVNVCLFVWQILTITVKVQCQKDMIHVNILEERILQRFLYLKSILSVVEMFFPLCHFICVFYMVCMLQHWFHAHTQSSTVLMLQHYISCISVNQHDSFITPVKGTRKSLSFCWLSLPQH